MIHWTEEVVKIGREDGDMIAVLDENGEDKFMMTRRASKEDKRRLLEIDLPL